MTESLGAAGPLAWPTEQWARLCLKQDGKQGPHLILSSSPHTYAVDHTHDHITHTDFSLLNWLLFIHPKQAPSPDRVVHLVSTV